MSEKTYNNFLLFLLSLFYTRHLDGFPHMPVFFLSKLSTNGKPFICANKLLINVDILFYTQTPQKLHNTKCNPSRELSFGVIVFTDFQLTDFVKNPILVKMVDLRAMYQISFL